MTRRAALLVLLAVAAGFAGCMGTAGDDEAPSVRVVSGELDHARPHQDALRVVVVSDGGLHTTVEFARDEWHLAALERALQERGPTRASIEAVPQALFEQVRARDVLAPDDLGDYRYDRMEMRAQSAGTPFDKAALDAQWTARLEELAAEDATRIPSAESPSSLLPAQP